MAQNDCKHDHVYSQFLQLFHDEFLGLSRTNYNFNKDLSQSVIFALCMNKDYLDFSQKFDSALYDTCVSNVTKVEHKALVVPLYRFPYIKSYRCVLFQQQNRISCKRFTLQPTFKFWSCDKIPDLKEINRIFGFKKRL